MDVRRAMTYVFDDPRWFAKLGKAGAIACIPLIGPLFFLPAFALQAIRNAAGGDESIDLPDCRLDGSTFMIGLKCQILTLVCALAAGLLTLPFWAMSDGESTP